MKITRNKMLILAVIVAYLVFMLVLIACAQPAAAKEFAPAGPAPADTPEYVNQWVPPFNWVKILHYGEQVTFKDDNGQVRVISYGGPADILPPDPAPAGGIQLEPLEEEAELFTPPYQESQVTHTTKGCNVYEIKVLGDQNVEYVIRGADFGEQGRLPGAYLLYNGVAWAELSDQPGLHCYASRGYLVVFSSINHNKVLLDK